MHFGVLGSGIIGLTTALELQEQFPTAQISIIADRFNEDTVSYVAAGIFRPGTSFMGPTQEITQQWMRDAFNYWDDIRRSKEASLAGVCQLSGYIFSRTTPSIVRNHFIEQLLPVYRRATEEELQLCQGGWKYGSFFTTCLTESRLFLPYATKKFLANGGQVLRQHVSSFSDVPGGVDVLLNCTGMGAKELCNDPHLVPIRGQVLKVRAPWIKTAFYGDLDTYVLPGFETVTIGGCRQYDSYNMEWCKYDSMAIKERCYNLLPSLKKAEIVRECVGLRPHRSVVRVEPELLTNAEGRRLKIVHNYGHGGYGVTTAPGTAKYAVQVVRDLLASNSKL
ncbi:D-aspartate oxidase [Drosophila grimshawi]|uniref:GH24186 n=1 Tax=Drosophila grimshawi TaxID=7222 RepID=B4K0H3_DROGR|nr:D-aspartate oxidase [Drosophila grimshawi]EDV90873.1 GH24186 [Drosophila grimshawi]